MPGKLPGEYPQGPGPGRPQTSDGRQVQKTTRSHNRGHRLQRESPWLCCLFEHHQVLNWHSARKNRREECVSTCCPGPLSRSVITVTFLHVGNGRRSVEEMLNSMCPHQTCASVHSVSWYFNQVLHVPAAVNFQGGGLCVHLLDHPWQDNTLSHYKYMPAALHNWIKREAVVSQNKRSCTTNEDTQWWWEIQNSSSFY